MAGILIVEEQVALNIVFITLKIIPNASASSQFIRGHGDDHLVSLGMNFSQVRH